MNCNLRFYHCGGGSYRQSDGEPPKTRSLPFCIAPKPFSCERHSMLTNRGATFSFLLSIIANCAFYQRGGG